MDDMHSTRRWSDGPDWHWKNARRAAETGWPPDVRVQELGWVSDPRALEAAEYLHCCGQGPEAHAAAEEKVPRIAAAVTAWDNPLLRDQLKILITGNCALDEIARLCGISATVVADVEFLFFDMRGQRQATSWINAHVIAPEQAAGNAALAVRLEYAFVAGPDGARAIIEPELQGLAPTGEQLFKQKLRLALKLQEALLTPLNTPAACRAFIKMAQSRELAEKRIQLAESKLQARREDAQYHRELACEKREVAGQREIRRLKEQARKAMMRRARQDAVARAIQDRQEQHRLEQEAAQRRAAASPLAALRWYASAGAPAPTVRAAAPLGAPAPAKCYGVLPGGEGLPAGVALALAEVSEVVGSAFIDNEPVEGCAEEQGAVRELAGAV